MRSTPRLASAWRKRAGGIFPYMGGSVNTDGRTSFRRVPECSTALLLLFGGRLLGFLGLLPFRLQPILDVGDAYEDRYEAYEGREDRQRAFQEIDHVGPPT